MTISDAPKYIKAASPSTNELVQFINAVSPLPLEYYLAPGYFFYHILYIQPINDYLGTEMLWLQLRIPSQEPLLFQ